MQCMSGCWPRHFMQIALDCYCQCRVIFFCRLRMHCDLASLTHLPVSKQRLHMLCDARPQRLALLDRVVDRLRSDGSGRVARLRALGALRRARAESPRRPRGRTRAFSRAARVRELPGVGRLGCRARRDLGGHTHALPLEAPRSSRRRTARALPGPAPSPPNIT